MVQDHQPPSRRTSTKPGGDVDPHTDMMMVILILFGIAGMGGPILFLLLVFFL